MNVISFKAGDRVLSYLRYGAGPPVICIPGGPGFDPVAYYATLDLPGHELVVLAPRGTGASTPPSTPDGYRMAGYVDDLEALRDHLGGDPLTLYGHSHGGSAALAYAITHPHCVDRIVIDGAPTRMDAAFDNEVADARHRFARAFADGERRLQESDAAGAELPRADSDERRRELLRAMLTRHVARLGPAQMAFLDGICAAPLNWQAAGVMFAEMRDGLDLLAPAATVEVPALVIAAQHDVVIPPASSRRLAAKLPAGSFVEVADAGHFEDVEAPRAFVAAVTSFLHEGTGR